MLKFIEWLQKELTTEHGEPTQAELIVWVRDIHDYLLNVDVTDQYSGKHYGDCTNQNVSCKICEYQNWLDDYEEYCRSYKNNISGL